MKKFVKITVVIIVIAAALYFVYQYYLSGKSTYQSIYLVPSNAALIIETDAAFDAWDKIIHSDAWNKAKYIHYLSKLNSEIKSIDSLINKKKLLLKAFGRRKITVSLHEYRTGEYDFLFIFNVGKAAQARNPQKIINSLLGKDFSLTQRDYNEQTIYELRDIEHGEMYYFMLVRNKLVVSENYKILESSVNEMNQMALGRDLDFIEVSKRISGKGLFNVYINYRYFPDYMKKLLGRNLESINSLKAKLNYSAFSFYVMPDGLLALEGYTGINDTVSSFFKTVLYSGNSDFKSAEVLPSRVASLVKIGFNDPVDYYKRSLSSFSATEYKNTLETLHKYERKLKIDLEENILSWIDNEIILVYTQPSNLGRNNEFTAVIKSKNKREPKKNLDYISEQIEKNFPVKIREVEYKHYTIRYISLPGILKALFGKMLDKIEKPYYTIIDNYVLFSNHPQTLKNIIDDYITGNTLVNSADYISFVKLFNKKNSAYAYFDIPVLYSNMKNFVSYETWQDLEYNKPYISSFPQAGVQIDNDRNLLHLMIKARYSENVEDFLPQNFNEQAIFSLFREKSDTGSMPDIYENWSSPKIIIHDLDASDMKEYYESGELKFEIELKQGLKHGTYRKYHENGELMVKGKYKDDMQDGSWKLYDEQKNLLEEKIYKDGKEKEDD
ncbi:MAG: DUF3352 domain-containing protein [Bacteroidales bacterium]|nr:DUF3352 domain-containing protein [Bacteroidales bacterium]